MAVYILTKLQKCNLCVDGLINILYQIRNSYRKVYTYTVQILFDR